MNQQSLKILWLTTQSNQFIAGASTGAVVLDLAAGDGVTTNAWTFANVGRREMKLFVWPGVTSQAANCTSGRHVLLSATTGTSVTWTPVANTTITYTDVTAGPPNPVHFYTNDRYVRLYNTLGALTTMTIVAGIMVEQRGS